MNEVTKKKYICILKHISIFNVVINQNTTAPPKGKGQGVLFLFLLFSLLLHTQRSVVPCAFSLSTLISLSKPNNNNNTPSPPAASTFATTRKEKQIH